MKIAHVLWSLNVGGLEQGLCWLLRYQVKQGLEPTVVCCRDEQGALRRQVDALGIPVRSARMRSGRDLFGSRRLKGILRDLGPDIVHSRVEDPASHAAIVSGLRRTTRLLHQDGGGEALHPGWSIRKTIMYRWLASRWHAAIASSPAMFQFLTRRAGFPHVRLILQSIPATDYVLPAREQRSRMRRERDIDENAFVVVGCGRLHEVKDWPLFIQTVAACKRKILFLIVGDGPERENLELMAHTSRAPVRFVGMQRPVAPWLALADVFLLTSICEGFGRAMVEAMASGLPIAAAPYQGMENDIFRHNREGLFANHRDPKELAELIETLSEDDVRRKTLGQNARSRAVTQFDMRREADQVLQLYQEICHACY